MIKSPRTALRSTWLSQDMRYVGLTERSVLQASSSCLRHVKSSSGAVTIGLSSPSSISSKGIAVGLSCWPQSRTGRRKRRSSPKHRTHSSSAVLKRVEHLGASLSMLTSHAVPFGTIFGTAAASGSGGFALRSTRAFMLSQQCAPLPSKKQLSQQLSFGRGPYMHMISICLYGLLVKTLSLIDISWLIYRCYVRACMLHACADQCGQV